MWIFEEKQQLTGFWWIIAFVLINTSIIIWLPFILSPGYVLKLSTVIWIVIIVDLIILILVITIFRFLHVRMDEEHIEFGYTPFIVKILFDQIRTARLVKHTFWQTGGFGVRLDQGKRWCYTARLGPTIEIDWDKQRRHAFSIFDHERLAVALKDFLGDRFSNEYSSGLNL